MKTPTPRTDEAKQIPEKFDELDYVVHEDFARQLETELAAAKAERDEWKRFADNRVADLQRADVSHGETIGNRDNWREVAEKLAEELALWRKSYPSSAPNSGINLALAAYRKLKEGK